MLGRFWFHTDRPDLIMFNHVAASAKEIRKIPYLVKQADAWIKEWKRHSFDHKNNSVSGRKRLRKSVIRGSTWLGSAYQ
jgi:hypothetical protein